MSAPNYFMTLILLLGTVLLIFVMHYRARQQQTRADLARDEALRDMAAKLNAAHAQTATTLADIQTRLGAIENILKTVE